MKQARAAFDAGRGYKGKGDLINAERYFRVALQYAPESSSVSSEAADEIDYFIPLMRIQRLLWEGKSSAAEQALQVLYERFSDNPVRKQTVSNILLQIQSPVGSALAAQPQEVDERAIAKSVRNVLQRYFQTHKSYPRRSDLPRVIGLERPAMAMFEVARYVPRNGGYLLVLRNKNDQNQTLTFENTGLLQ